MMGAYLLGDVATTKEGDTIPADVRLRTRRLRTNPTERVHPQLTRAGREEFANNATAASREREEQRNKIAQFTAT